MKKLLAILVMLMMTSSFAAADLPYDEKADAQAELAQALKQAGVSNKKVLVVFGANWCPDCREFDKALHGKSAPLIDGQFVVVKVDVGRFDKHMDIAKAYGNPTRKGIPAAVVLAADNKVLYSTKGGELSNARRMGDNGVYEFLSKNIATAK